MTSRALSTSKGMPTDTLSDISTHVGKKAVRLLEASELQVTKKHSGVCSSGCWGDSGGAGPWCRQLL